MEQPVKFEKWLYQNHKLTSLNQVRNKQKYINSYETYCENLKEACMSAYERELEEWQTKMLPITIPILISIFLIAIRVLDS
ncbi:hypothetical protein NHG29_01640 [Aerococcaceae bacterium NML160702]|nr:hypothetical protein [Aerococcaceae bacterium NML160702]